MAYYRKRGATWYFTIIGADGRKIERPGCSNRRETEAMAAAAEAEAAKIRSGFVDARALAVLSHGKAPLSRHLSDWQADMLSRGDTGKHAKLYADRARRLLALACGAKYPDIAPGRRATQNARQRADAALAKILDAARLSGITLSRVQGGLATLRTVGLSLGSLNHHRAAARSFVLWLRKDGRLADDPLIGLASYNAKADPRHDRRALSLDELQRLIAVAASGPTYKRMTGRARSLCYRLATTTGLRYSEIQSITTTGLTFGDSPTVQVAAAYCKNGEPATLPLPGDLAHDLADFVASIPEGAPVFDLPEGGGAAMVRFDLERADIPYKDASGRPFDFHALRGMCATMLDAAGVSPRTVQRLMRHSKLEMTDRYTRPRLVDIERAAERLPVLRPSEAPADPPEAARATGTDGKHISNPFAEYLPNGGDGLGGFLRGADVMAQKDNPSPMPHIPLGTRGLEGSGGVLRENFRVTGVGLEPTTNGLTYRKAISASPCGERGLRVRHHGLAEHLPNDTCRMPNDLAVVVVAWPRLPEAVRAGIVAMVRAAGGDHAKG